MAIAVTYKGALFACLLGVILAQEIDPALKELIAISPVDGDLLDNPTEFPQVLPKNLQLKLEQARLVREQAKNAVYNFTTTLDDGIMDNKQGRQETRNGFKVEGSYWYSDGFFRRTVSYIADENGYRIVSDTSEPLGNGPTVDANGRADVYTNIGGQESEYSITKDDIARYRDIKLLPTAITPVAELTV